MVYLFALMLDLGLASLFTVGREAGSNSGRDSQVGQVEPRKHQTGTYYHMLYGVLDFS